jgi:hypothetical protein
MLGVDDITLISLFIDDDCELDLYVIVNIYVPATRFPVFLNDEVVTVWIPFINYFYT